MLTQGGQEHIRLVQVRAVAGIGDDHLAVPPTRGLADGDQVWVAPAARTLRGRRRTSPYAIIRAADRKVFWATGLPMPGQGW